MLLLVFASYSLNGQEDRIQLNGSIKSMNNDVYDVLVVNKNTNTSTISDTLGVFKIPVRIGDSLQFTSVQYLPKNIRITNAIINQKNIVVDLTDKVINLREVTVTPYNLTGTLDLDLDRLGLKNVVTSSTLGLPNANIDKMTQGERLLLEADRGKYIRFATIEDRGKLNQALSYLFPAVIINTHKIMNRVSGRTKSLEDRVARDEKMEFENALIAKFSKETLSQEFGIPRSAIDGFLTYCMSQNDFSVKLQTGNTISVWEYLRGKSVEFKEIDNLKE
ncbi:MAG: hypothetical protein WA810_15010 [Maribacter sp.]